MGKVSLYLKPLYFGLYKAEAIRMLEYELEMYSWIPFILGLFRRGTWPVSSVLYFINILLYTWYFFNENSILNPEGDTISVTLDKISGL